MKVYVSAVVAAPTPKILKNKGKAEKMEWKGKEWIREKIVKVETQRRENER